MENQMNLEDECDIDNLNESIEVQPSSMIFVLEQNTPDHKFMDLPALQINTQRYQSTNNLITNISSSKYKSHTQSASPQSSISNINFG